MQITTLSAGRIVRFFVVLTAFTALLLAPLSATAQGNVDLYTGTSTYTIPLVTPPGTNGMGPNLALQYNSGGGGDLLGDGWSLAGLGSIERRGPNYGLTPTYTSNDTFVLNWSGGGKLVYTGKDLTNTVGNFYHTEIENFMRIEYISFGNSWLVTDKSGTQYMFMTPQKNPGNATQTFSWKLDRVIDKHGNYWGITYDIDPVGGDIYPKHIAYTMGTSLPCRWDISSCRTMDFFLEPRTDISYGYTSGDKITSDQRLQRIEVKLGGKLVRKYVFGYTETPIFGRGVARTTQLTSVTEYGADGDTAGAIPLPATTFYYHADPAATPSLIQTQVVGDEAANFYGLGGPFTGSGNNSECTYLTDMDNDGYPDVITGGTGRTYNYKKNGPNGFSAGVNLYVDTAGTDYLAAQALLPALCDVVTQEKVLRVVKQQIVVGSPLPDGTIPTVTVAHKVTAETIVSVRDTVLIDLDGDGNTDILYNPSSGADAGKWFWWKKKDGDALPRWSCTGPNCLDGRLYDRAGIVNPPPVNLNIPASTGRPPRLRRCRNGETVAATVPEDHDVTLADMDGDGLIDIVNISRAQYNVPCDITLDTVASFTLTWYKNLGNGINGLSFGNGVAIQLDTNSHYPNGSTYTGESLPPGAQAVALIDMNNDGLPDFVFLSVEPASNKIVLQYYPNRGANGFDTYRYMAFIKDPVSQLLSPLYVPFDPTETNYLNDPGIREYHRFTDINGDGYVDILVGIAGSYGYFPGQKEGTWGPFIPLDFAPTQTLKRNNFLAMADMNGDGFPDIVQGNTSDYRYSALDMTNNHRHLQRVTNSLSGQTSFNYTRLHSVNTIRWVPSFMTTLADYNIAKTQYTFNGGNYVGWPHNEFRGYGMVNVTDSAGFPSRTSYYQDHERKGLVYQSDGWPTATDVTGYTTVSNYYVGTPSAGVSRVDLVARVEETFGSRSLLVKMTARNDYLYDSYGNVRQVATSGDTTPTRFAITDYAYNSPAYIVNRPYHTQTSLYSATGSKTSEAWFSYDGQAKGVAPTKGDLTSQENWLLGGVNPVTKFAYDGFGNRIGTLDAKGNACASPGNGYTSLVQYDDTYKTYPVSATNALCQSTTSTYWGVGVTPLSSSSVTGAYAYPGALATVTDPNNVRSDSYYDVLGRLKASVVPPDTASAPSTIWTYTVSHTVDNSVKLERRQSPEMGADYLTSITFLDGFGRTIQTKNEGIAPDQWITQNTIYNTRDLLESVSVPYITAAPTLTSRLLPQPRTVTDYDGLGRPIKVTGPDGTFTTAAYNLWDVTTTDAKGNATTRSYDALKRLTNVVEPTGGGMTRYYYDSFNLATGHITQSVRDAVGNFVSQTELDTLGRAVSSVDADRGRRTYTYDANGNMLAQTDAKNQQLTFSYDSLNRIATKTYPDAKVVRYNYDVAFLGAYGIGHLSSVMDSSGYTVYAYDQRGRQVENYKSIGASSYSLKTSYDSLDRADTLTYPDGEVVKNTYDAQGLLAKVSSITNAPQEYLSSITYTPLGKVASKTYGNGKVTTYDYYDADGAVYYGPASFRLRRITTPGLQFLNYTYDKAGNVIRIVDPLHSAGENFDGYDSLNRLTLAGSLALPAYIHRYTYDAIGNMLTGPTGTFTYPAPGAAHPHAPLSDGACTYGYDANGSQVSNVCGTVAKYSGWDYDNRLSYVYDTTKFYGQYTYDFAGNRVTKVENGVTTITPFPHYRVIGGAVTKYYFANGERIAERVGGNLPGNVFYYHSDHLGSSNIVSNSAGTEVKATQFYPYGSTRSETGSKTLEQKYNGKDFDMATGLYNYGARYYNPAAMHFVSADDVVADPSNPQSFNRYSYVLNNPIRLVDPTGREPAPKLGTSSYTEILRAQLSYQEATYSGLPDLPLQRVYPEQLLLGGAASLKIGYEAGLIAGAKYGLNPYAQAAVATLATKEAYNSLSGDLGEVINASGVVLVNSGKKHYVGVRYKDKAAAYKPTNFSGSLADTTTFGKFPIGFDFRLFFDLYAEGAFVGITNTLYGGLDEKGDWSMRLSSGPILATSPNNKRSMNPEAFPLCAFGICGDPGFGFGFGWETSKGNQSGGGGGGSHVEGDAYCPGECK